MFMLLGLLVFTVVVVGVVGVIGVVGVVGVVGFVWGYYGRQAIPTSCAQMCVCVGVWVCVSGVYEWCAYYLHVLGVFVTVYVLGVQLCIYVFCVRACAYMCECCLYACFHSLS